MWIILSWTGYALAAGGAEFCKWPDNELELTLAWIFYRYNRGFCCDTSRGNQNKFPSDISLFLVKPRNSLWFIRPKIHYHIYNLFLSWTRRNQKTPFHPVSLGAILILSYILPSVRRSSRRALSFRFPNQISVCIYPLPNTCHMHGIFLAFSFHGPSFTWLEAQSWRTWLICFHQSVNSSHVVFFFLCSSAGPSRAWVPRFWGF